VDEILTQQVQQALRRDRTIDITTIGRKSGKPRRIEIWFYRADGRFFLSGSPGPRSWYANLLAHPDFTFHLKESMRADLPARARSISDPQERRAIFTTILKDLGMSRDLDAWLRDSPLMEIEFTSRGDG
jgi:deazaflavin-dependent oxidoreductase (nitroreductase family)